MKKRVPFSALCFLLLVSCKKEYSYIENFAGTLITCFQGKHACLGITDTPYSRSSLTGGFTFQEGTDYQYAWSDAPYNQVNKLFGATDCGNYFPSRENSAMVGFRHIANTDLIELLGYVHREDAYRNGYNFRHASLFVVPRFQPVSLMISVMNSFYRYSANGNSEAIMKRFCSESTFRGRRIGTWFGGQRTAPQTLSIAHQETVSVGSRFPKTLNLMDDDQLCSKSTDPITYLERHPSGIYATYQTECQGTVQVQYLGCDTKIDSNLYQGTSGNSDPGFRYRITCN